MRAALDETTPSDARGIFYVVAAVVVIADEQEAATALSRVVNEPGRRKPFHWHQEGVNIRHRMVECLKELGAVSHVCVHYPTARRGQEQARARALTELLPHLLDDGTTELLIERRTQRGDARDRQTILRALQEMGAPGALRYDWRDKSERVLWLADAVCGVVREYLLQTPEAGYYDELKATGVVAEPIYLAPGQT